MKIVGILGGVGSGKSTIGRLFEELGAVRLDADRLGHEVLREVEVRDEIRLEFGSGVFDTEGWIDRPRLAKMVFEPGEVGANRLRALERITHPRIAVRIQEELDRLRGVGAEIVILDAPVLLKAGWDRLCDHLIFVEASDEQRMQRVAERGWTQQQWRQREAAQESLDEKRGRCDVTISNEGDLRQAREQVASWFRRWSTDS